MANTAQASTQSFPGDEADRPVPVRSPNRTKRFLVWTAGIIVIGGMLIAVLLPSLCRSSETANRVKCASNLKQIGQAILLYTQENGGQYPTSLSVLMSHEDLVAEVVTCPSSADERSPATNAAGIIADVAAAETNAPGHMHCLSYIYVGRGLTDKTASETTIVAYEPMENHSRDITNVLFGDGHVDSLGKQPWLQAAAASGLKLDAAPARQP